MAWPTVIPLVSVLVVIVCCAVGMLYGGWMTREQVVRTSGSRCEIAGRSAKTLTSSLWSGTFCAGDYKCMMDVYLLLLLGMVGEICLLGGLVYGGVRYWLGHGQDYIFNGILVFSSFSVGLVPILWLLYVLTTTGSTYACNGIAFYVYGGGAMILFVTVLYVNVRLCMGVDGSTGGRIRIKPPMSPPPMPMPAPTATSAAQPVVFRPVTGRIVAAPQL